MTDQAAVSYEGINQSFGYKQELRRALRLFSLYAVAFSIISITTGLFANYGFGLAHLGPAMIWLWPLPRSDSCWWRWSSPSWARESHWPATRTSGERGCGTPPTAGSPVS